MTNLSHVVQDERTARIALSMIVEPDDAGQAVSWANWERLRCSDSPSVMTP